MPMIDIYTHIFPDRYFAEMSRASAGLGHLAERFRAIPPLFDLDARFRQMDGAGDGYQQVVSLPNPPIEDMVEGPTASLLARVGNDAMAELCAKHPDRFPAFVAGLNLHDVDGAVAEARRAIGELGARGVQIFTNVAGRPLDDERYAPVFAVAAELNLPIWLHPARTAAMTDYAGEARSRYEMWWCFGWPYETSVAISQEYFEPGVSRVYIATGLNFPDALAGGVAAGRNSSPLLLVPPTGAPQSVIDEIARLNPDQIHVLGGFPSVPPNVHTQLAAFTPAPLVPPADRLDFMLSQGAWANVNGDTVTGLEEVDFDRQVELADEIGDEDEGPPQQSDDDELVGPGVEGRDLPCQPLDTGGDGLGRDHLLDHMVRRRHARARPLVCALAGLVPGAILLAMSDPDNPPDEPP